MLDIKNATDIEILKWLKECHINTDFPSEVRVVEAYDNAIKALEEKERNEGKWKIAFHGCTGAYYLCSCCGEGRAVINGEDYSSLDEFKFCPQCGAKMSVIPKPEKPIKAMWISGAKDPTGQYFEDEVMCSNCMHSEPMSYMFKENGMICPKCGATMERGPRV